MIFKGALNDDFLQKFFTWEDDDWKWVKHVAWLIAGAFLLKAISSREQGTGDRGQRIDYSRGGWERTVDERIPIRRGIEGTRETLRRMAALVRRDHQDARIRKLAERIVRNCPGHGFECEIKSIYDFCRDDVTYRRDPVDSERVQDARRTLQSGVGDCDDKTLLLCSLLSAMGHRTRFGLLSNSPRDWSHVFCEVFISGRWIALDPTPEKFIAGQAGRAIYRSHYDIFIQS